MSIVDQVNVGPGAHGTEFIVKGEVKEWKLRRVKVLGKGSYGLATLVEDLETNELLVAKEVNMQCIKKAEEIENLYKEIKILKTVKHPNIVEYKDCSYDQTHQMIILMEYCDGGDLSQKISSHAAANQRMTENEIARIFIELLMAIRHLHLEHRILHRDLKPQNIFLTTDGSIKLGDFGVSTILGQSVDFAKTFCGSPYYLAPELCEEKPYNGKADLWSIGVILYECASLGARPFSGKNLVALVLQITRADYTPLDAAECGISNELKDIIHSFLQRLPDARPTIRRLLRLPYTTNKVLTLPRHILMSEDYDKQLGTRRLLRKMAKEKQQAAATKLDPELEQWMAKDRQALTKMEQEQMGHRHSDLLDDHGISEAQKQQMAQEAARLAEKQRTEEELWNSKYEDDEFEDDEDADDDDGPETEADQYAGWSMLPMNTMSFSL